MTLTEFIAQMIELRICIPRYAPDIDNEMLDAWYKCFATTSRDAFAQACMMAKENEKAFPSIACLKGYLAGGSADRVFNKAEMPLFPPRWDEIKAKHGTNLNIENMPAKFMLEEGFFRLRSSPHHYFRYVFDKPVKDQVPYEFVFPNIVDPVFEHQKVLDKIPRPSSGIEDVPF